MFTASIAGNIGTAAETKSVGTTTVTTWSVAVEQRGKDGKTTQWVRCNLWGQRGEKVAPYLTKGGKVAVSGELKLMGKDGKVFADLEVSNVTLMGGGQGTEAAPRNEQPTQSNAMDDEIPF